jgi:hypothetical protein
MTQIQRAQRRFSVRYAKIFWQRIQGAGERWDQRFTFIVGAFTPRSTRRMNSTGHF